MREHPASTMNDKRVALARETAIPHPGASPSWWMPTSSPPPSCRVWMELRQQLRQDDPAARSGAWTSRIRVGCLADGAPLAQAAPQSA